jgi:hypothetical protein
MGGAGARGGVRPVESLLPPREGKVDVSAGEPHATNDALWESPMHTPRNSGVAAPHRQQAQGGEHDRARLRVPTGSRSGAWSLVGLHSLGGDVVVEVGQQEA